MQLYNKNNKKKTNKRAIQKVNKKSINKLKKLKHKIKMQVLKLKKQRKQLNLIKNKNNVIASMEFASIKNALATKITKV